MTGNSRNLESEVKLAITKLLLSRGPLTFEELRRELEDSGIFIRSRLLRLIVASMIRDGVLIKQVDVGRRKFVIKLARP